MEEANKKDEFEEDKSAFFDIALDMLCIADLEGYFKALNKSFERVLGWTSEELMAKPFVEFVHPDDKEATLNEISNLNHGLNVVDFDNRYLCKDGTYKWLSWHSYPMKEKGLVYAVTRDITERKKIEKNLKLSEEKYRKLLEDSPVGIIVSSSTNILYANRTLLNIVGEETLEEVKVKHFTEFIHPDDRHMLIEKVKKREDFDDENFNYEIRVIRKDGDIRYCKLSSSVIYINDERYSQASFFDITEAKIAQETIQKQMQELETKNAELERFTYTVSHDLKSPLITIKGFLGHLSADAKIGRLDRFESDIKRIAKAADKMHSLLEDLLSLSRIGRILNPSSEFPMSEPLKEAGELLQSSFEAANIKIIYDKNIPAVYGDKIRIREVWQNLIENAVKYMGDQTNPEITIGCEYQENNDVFYIKDNGIGLESKYYQKIFGLFDKLDASSEGTGIGLAIVKRIIELHNGKIWVESDGLGKGSTFYFIINNKESE